MKTTPRELQQLYRSGANICGHLRAERGLETNNREIIEIAYDLQSGSYVEAMRDPAVAAHKADYAIRIASVIAEHLPQPRSILEAGVGEATTLSGVLREVRSNASSRPLEAFGFDLSWSRLKLAQQWLRDNRVQDVELCTGDLCNIPFAENGVDVVYTAHSVEPNGGQEEGILEELYRITRRLLVLVEPGYEFACEEGKRRMERHGYCRGLADYARDAGWDVAEHRLLGTSANPLNPSAVTVIRKSNGVQGADTGSDVYACPWTRSPLQRGENVWFSPENLSVYPVIGGIACLRRENAIMASAFEAA